MLGLKGMCICSDEFKCWHVGFGKRTNYKNANDRNGLLPNGRKIVSENWKTMELLDKM
jgi:hypothetical protein